MHYGNGVLIGAIFRNHFAELSDLRGYRVLPWLQYLFVQICELLALFVALLCCCGRNIVYLVISLLALYFTP
jgi:hypothetical protein